MFLRSWRFFRLSVPPAVMLATQIVNAQSYIFDDFEDGDVRDRAPIRWVNDWGGQLDAEEGKLQLSGTGTFVASAAVLPQSGWSMQTRGSLHGGNHVGVGMLFREGGNVWLGFRPSGLLEVGAPGVTLRGEFTDFDPEDVMLRFDAFNDTISGWAWEPGQPMPTDPIVVVETPVLSGRPAMWMGGPAVAQFEFFEAATIPLPELVDGDVDLNRVLDAADIDQLSEAIRTQTGLNRRLDLNGDGEVNDRDRQYWVVELKRTWMGDANLDGEFNSGDFVDVFRSGQYEDESVGNSTWKTGDWNGDAKFDSGDFVVAFRDGGFEHGPRAAKNVPEPSSRLAWLSLWTWIVGWKSSRPGDDESLRSI